MNDISINIRLIHDMLASVGIKDPRHEIDLIIEDVCGERISDISKIEDKYIIPITNIAKKRMLTLMPLPYILGWQYFFGFKFSVTRDTLIPRFDSECLVQGALNSIGSSMRHCRILDLYAGTGCLGLSLSKLLLDRSITSDITLIDYSDSAIAVSMRNAESMNLIDRSRFIVADLLNIADCEALSSKYDIIFANPPYISSNEFEFLNPSVKDFEPRFAIDGGDDGCDHYRKILDILNQVIVRNGSAFIEIGNFNIAMSIFKENDSFSSDVILDLNNIPRAIKLTYDIYKSNI